MGSSKVIFGAETGIYVMDVENCMATDDICTSDVHCNVGEICLNGACEDVTYEVTGFGESCVRDSLGVAVDINNYDSILSGINSGEYTINDDYCNEGLLCNINTFECDAPSGCAQDCTSLGMYCSSMISGICGGEGASCMSTEISPDGLDETHMPLDSMCTTGFTCNHESGVCVSVCENGVQDTGELGIDCGGTCTLCPGTCLVDLDCDQGELCYTNVCVRGCSGDNDCQSGEDCTNGICLPTISLTAGDSCLRSIETQSMIDLPSADNVEGWQALYDGIGTGIFELSVCDTGLICDPMGLLCVEQVLGLGLPCADGLGPGNECTDNDGVKVGHCNSDLICGGENAMCYPDQNKLCANGLICDPITEICIVSDLKNSGEVCIVNSDCLYNNCVNGICGGVGAVCAIDSECMSTASCENDICTVLPQESVCAYGLMLINDPLNPKIVLYADKDISTLNYVCTIEDSTATSTLFSTDNWDEQYYYARVAYDSSVEIDDIDCKQGSVALNTEMYSLGGRDYDVYFKNPTVVSGSVECDMQVYGSVLATIDVTQYELLNNIVMYDSATGYTEILLPFDMEFVNGELVSCGLNYDENTIPGISISFDTEYTSTTNGYCLLDATKKLSAAKKITSTGNLITLNISEIATCSDAGGIGGACTAVVNSAAGCTGLNYITSGLIQKSPSSPNPNNIILAMQPSAANDLAALAQAKASAKA